MLGQAQAAVDFTSLGLSPELFTLPAFSLLGLTLGPFALRWYSLAYIGGIIIGVSFSCIRCIIPCNGVQIAVF